MAVVPSAPALLPEYVGRDDLVAALRDRATDAVRSVCREADAVVLVTATDRSPRSARVPLGRRVGEELLARAAVAGPVDAVEVAWDATPGRCLELGRSLASRPGGLALVVVADGSARRSKKAPGHLDWRSFAVDEAIVRGLSSPDPTALAGLDAALCGDLLVGGRAPLQVLAGAFGEGSAYETVRCEVEDPFGVLYAVAELRAR